MPVGIQEPQRLPQRRAAGCKCRSELAREARWAATLKALGTAANRGLRQLRVACRRTRERQRFRRADRRQAGTPPPAECLQRPRDVSHRHAAHRWASARVRIARAPTGRRRELEFVQTRDRSDNWARAVAVPGAVGQDSGWVTLNTNESPYPPSPKVIWRETSHRRERLKSCSMTSIGWDGFGGSQDRSLRSHPTSRYLACLSGVLSETPTKRPEGFIPLAPISSSVDASNTQSIGTFGKLRIERSGHTS